MPTKERRRKQFKRGQFSRKEPVPCQRCYFPLDRQGVCEACERRRRAQ